MTREQAIKELKIIREDYWDEYNDPMPALDMAIKALEPCYNPDEWCHDCSEYDQDKHCCPRYNKVIRNAVEEIKQPKTGHWIPVSERLPEYGKEVLTCSNGGFIEIQSLEDGGYWENQKGDWTDFDEVIACMPLPEPYEPQESEE
jgi:hypothetical protein